MLQGLFKRAENTIDSVVAKYVGRVTTAIPLVIAGGFATAALTVKLVDTYGAVAGYSLMAALFAMIGLITMAVVGTEARPSDGTASEAPVAATSDDASQPSSSAEGPDLLTSELLTPEVRAFLSSAAPMALPSIARGIGRNLPLILILALIGFVISRFAETSSGLAASDENGGSGEMPTDMAAAPPAA
jgi:hypothetical protein